MENGAPDNDFHPTGEFSVGRAARKRAVIRRNSISSWRGSTPSASMTALTIESPISDPDQFHIVVLCQRFRDDRRSVRLVLPHRECRHDQERQDRRDQKPAHDGDRHRSPEDAPRERDHAENRGQRVSTTERARRTVASMMAR
jgi:hypothetical protein